MMISEVATEGRTIPILYLCKQGVAALFIFFRNEHFQNAARWAQGPRTSGARAPHFENVHFLSSYVLSKYRGQFYIIFHF